ncbi:MAG TPA: O-antigen ligase family protein, partial [Saprospiraceae bacterium]|nr:O-antigen ligase family protein [Saprospiraceae bacterium]
SNFAAFANNVAFTYFFFLWYQRREYTRPSIGILLWMACMTTFAGLVITGSRGALISLLVSVVLIVAYEFQLRRMLAKLVLLALPMVLVLQTFDLDRIVNLLPAWNRVVTLAGKEEARTTLWGQGAEAFRDSYFIGLGIEQFKNPDNYRKYVHKTQNVSVASQHGLVLHNDYLTVLFEYGIPAFICFISFYYGIYWRLRIGQKSDPSWFVFIVCFWNMAIFSMFASSFQSHSMWLVYNILALAAYWYAKPSAFAISPKTATAS